MKRSNTLHDKTAKPRGTIVWIEEDGGENFGEVKEIGIRNENDFSIDCQYQMRSYTLTLKSSDGIHFEGAYVCRYPDQTQPVLVQFQRDKTKQGSLLSGSWVEDGEKYHCIIELFI